jgi:Tryptophan halogenase
MVRSTAFILLFASLLLGRTFHEPFQSFKASLFCDRAIWGGWQRTDEPIRPYTTAEAMNAGWCWRIDHEFLINRGCRNAQCQELVQLDVRNVKADWYFICKATGPSARTEADCTRGIESRMNTLNLGPIPFLASTYLGFALAPAIEPGDLNSAAFCGIYR